MTYEEYIEEMDTWHHWREIMKTTPVARRLSYRDWKARCPREWRMAHSDEIRYYL